MDYYLVSEARSASRNWRWKLTSLPSSKKPIKKRQQLESYAHFVKKNIIA